MTSSDLWDADAAARYDDPDDPMFSPEVLDPTLDALQSLAGGGRVLELAIGTGRVGIPLAARGLEVVGIELSPPMVDRLHEKAPDLPVTVGIVLVLAALVIVANIVVDILYAFIDPRVRVG